MEKFVNEYKIDKNFLDEFVKNWLKNLIFKPLNYILSVLIIVSGILITMFSMAHKLDRKYNFMGFLFIMVGIIYIISYHLSFKRIRKLYKSRMDILCKEGKVLQNEFNSNECIVNSNDEAKKQNIPLSLIKGRFSSDNYYFVVFEGAIVVSLQKNGFISGTFEEFKAFIEKFPVKKNIIPIFITVSQLILVILSFTIIFKLL